MTRMPPERACGLAVAVVLIWCDYAPAEVQTRFRFSHLSIFDQGDPEDRDDDRQLLRTDDDLSATQANLQGSLGGHTASQQMTIDIDNGVLHSMVGSGSTSDAGDSGGAQTFSNVGFDVTTEPVFYYLDANLTRQDTLSRSSVSLGSDLTGIPIAQRILNGLSDSITETGTIPVGERYQFDVLASGNATFDFALLLGGVRWEEPVNGLFTDAERWTAKLVPQATGGVDSAVFDVNTNPYTVTFDQSVTHRAALVRRGNVTFDLGSHTYTLDELTVQPSPGNTASLTVTGSGAAVGVAASPRDPREPLEANEPDPQLRSKVWRVCCDLGTDVRIDGVVEVPTARFDGSVDIGSDTGDAELRVNELSVGFTKIGFLGVGGNAGRGQLTTQNAIVGEEAITRTDLLQGGPVTTRSDGTVVIGSGGRWDANELTIVGQHGIGRVRVNQGDAVFPGLTLGEGFGSGSLIIEDALVALGNQVTVGKTGSGVLSLKDASVAPIVAALVASDHLDLVIGRDGLVRLDGQSELRADTVNVGTSEGSGNEADLEIENGARFLLGTTTGLSPGESGIAQVGVDGPGRVNVGTSGALTSFWGIKTELRVDGEVRVGANGRVVVGNLWDDFLTAGSDGTLNLRAGGTLSGDGIIRAHVQVSGGSPSFTGRVEPGTSPGTLTIDGDYHQEAGSILELELSGTVGNELHDVLRITGDTTIDGTVRLKFIDGFAPRKGDTFAVLDVNGGMDFAEADFQVRNLQPGFEFDVNLDGGKMNIMAMNDGVFRLFGDFNGNRTLDAEDIDLLTLEVRNGTNKEEMDLNLDGTVDQNDRRFWVKDIDVKASYFGDANLDGEFSSGDLVALFTTGEYEDGILMNSTWATGDFDGDGEFGTGDLVAAFTDGGYELGPRLPANTVPEPTSFAMLIIGLIRITTVSRSRRTGV